MLRNKQYLFKQVAGSAASPLHILLPRSGLYSRKKNNHKAGSSRGCAGPLLAAEFGLPVSQLLGVALFYSLAQPAQQSSVTQSAASIAAAPSPFCPPKRKRVTYKLRQMAEWD